MPQIWTNAPGPRAGVDGSNNIQQSSASGQDVVPVLYPAVQPSKTPDPVATGPATLFVSGDPGTFALTGNDAGIIVHRELAGGTGTYVLTGNAGGIRLARKVAGATGVYTETGSAAGIILSRKLSGATGAFTETGNDGLFKLVPGSTQLFIAGETGVFAVTGNDGAFKLVARPEAQGGISGYLKREKGYSRLGGNVMVQTMGEATERAEKIMLGWRDDEEALLVIQIIQSFYD